MMNKPWLKNYPQGAQAEIGALPYNTIPDLFTAICEKHPAAPAFHNLGHTLSYAETKARVDQFCAFLQHELKLEKGDRIGIMLPNVLQHPVVSFAALQAGLVIVNINPLYTPRELAAQLKDSGTKTLVVLENMAHTVDKACKEISLDHIITTQLADLHTAPRRWLINAVVRYIKRAIPDYQLTNTLSFRTALRLGAKHTRADVAIEAQDTAFLQYTGGTTGLSKGAVLSHHNILSNLEQLYLFHASETGLGDSQEIMLTALPLYHIYALTVGALLSIKLAGLNVLITNPRDIPALAKQFQQWSFTIISGVNTLYKHLFAHPEFVKGDFSHFKLCTAGGMPLEAAVDQRFYELTGRHLIEGYGLTETSPVLCTTLPNPASFSGTIGLPMPSTDISIRDDHEQALPLGEAGELCAKGPQVMHGYWQNSEATTAAFTHDGYFKTGDIAIMDENGFIRIVDRKKDMILVSGFNVYPNEIEKIIAEHPAVLEVACIGVPDTESQEAVKAFVVIKPGQSLSQAELIEYCTPLLTAYKRPKHIEFIDELPKSNVGKILRRELR